MFKTRTVHSTIVELENGDEIECELAFKPVEWLDMHKQVVGNKIVIAYNVLDDRRDAEDLMGDCMGRIIDAYNGRDAQRAEVCELAGCDRYGDKNLDLVWRHNEDVAIERYLVQVRKDYALCDVVDRLFDEDEREDVTWDEVNERLHSDAYGACWDRVEYEMAMASVLSAMWGEPAYWPGDPDAVMLDVYDHSGQSWSISGGGMQCRWDTSRGVGAWVPDKCLLQEIDACVAHGEDRRAACVKFARQFLDEYNEIISGNVYGCTVEVFDFDGEQVSEDSCRGFVGGGYAKEVLLSDYFTPTVEQLSKEWEETVCHGS